MITTVVTVTSTFLAGTFGAAAVAALILFLIMRELTSAHAEESGSMRSKILSHTLLVPISPLLVVFAFIVAVKVLEVLWVLLGLALRVTPSREAKATWWSGVPVWTPVSNQSASGPIWHEAPRANGGS